MRAAIRRGTAVFFALGAFAACQLIAGLEDRQVRGSDAGGDATGDAGEDPCALVGLPPRPATSSSPDDALTIVFALGSIDFGFDAGVTGPYGLNLDKTCTCPGPSTCTPPIDASVVCDVKQGIDNNGNLLFRKAAEYN